MGTKNFIKSLIGKTRFDKVFLGSLKIYLESNWNENLRNAGFNNSDKNSKILLILLKNIGQLTVEKTEIIEVSKNGNFEQNSLLN